MKGVRSVIDSGFNELRAKACNADARPLARFQHGEPFKRIKACFHLSAHVQASCKLHRSPPEACQPHCHSDQRAKQKWIRSNVQARQMAAIITGRITGIRSLILDVREAEGFNECHLTGGAWLI